MMDRASLAGMGDEFRSRLRERSQVPKLSLPPQNPLPLREIGASDVLLTETSSWENALVGYYTQEGRKNRFIPGALLTSVKPLTVHRAPRHDPGFRTFERSLQLGRIFANGAWHTLPEGGRIDFARPHYRFPEAPFLPPAPPGYQQSLVLNTATLQSFFEMMELNASGITAKPGVLEALHGQSVALHVTENLSTAQWYLFSKKAEEEDVKLLVVPTPGVVLPQPLLEVCQPEDPWALFSAMEAKIFVARDTDYALMVTGGDFVVPVSEKTRFESLFVRMDYDTEGRLTGGETELAKAVREGRHIVLKGRFSEEFARKIETLLTPTPQIILNGTLCMPHPATRITLLTDDGTHFTGINTFGVSDATDFFFERLTPAARKRLEACYQKLGLKACAGHFTGCPHGAAAQMRWVEALEERLHLAAGRPLVQHQPLVSSSISDAAPSEAPTTPAMLMDWLYGEEKLPFVFLVSESGTGKTHFMQQKLPKHMAEKGDPLTVYHGMSRLREWLTHPDGKAILFVDEANISDEDYLIFDSLARGVREVWLDGKCYPLSEGHRVVFAGNPEHYGGRKQADLFRRFPNYKVFREQPLARILKPLLQAAAFEKPEAVFACIEQWFQAAKAAGLNITPRNAQMMVLKAFEKKVIFPGFPELLLVEQAILDVLKSLHPDPAKTRTLRQTLKKDSPLWKAEGQALKDALTHTLPQTADKNWVWTPSRQKLALTLLSLLRIREMKQSGVLQQAHGLNGFLLEGMPGLGKSRLLQAVLKEKNIPFVSIPLNDATEARRLLLQAFRQGMVAVIDEFNSFPDESLLNSLLSGIDPEDPARRPIPGFCVLATQNPASMQQKEMLSKALNNRLMTLSLKEYTEAELQCILSATSGWSATHMERRLEEWRHAKAYARQQGLQEPDIRTLFEQPEKDRREAERPVVSRGSSQSPG